MPVEVAEQAVTAPLFPANPPHTEGVAAGPTAITAVSKGPYLLQTKGEIPQTQRKTQSGVRLLYKTNREPVVFNKRFSSILSNRRQQFAKQQRCDQREWQRDRLCFWQWLQLRQTAEHRDGRGRRRRRRWRGQVLRNTALVFVVQSAFHRLGCCQALYILTRRSLLCRCSSVSHTSIVSSFLLVS